MSDTPYIDFSKQGVCKETTHYNKEDEKSRISVVGPKPGSEGTKGPVACPCGWGPNGTPPANHEGAYVATWHNGINTHHRAHFLLIIHTQPVVPIFHWVNQYQLLVSVGLNI